MRDTLPIDGALPEILAALREPGVLVLEAPPGAGKTTRVPLAMYEAGFADKGEILILQPRRLAARLAARRVASELNEPLGRTVGYQVRFQEIASPATRIRFLTEGLLTRKLLADPELDGVAAVLLDEFHERHLAGDLGLALLKRLRAGARPDLKIAVMSATLDGDAVAKFLDGAPLVRSLGRRFAVETEFLAGADERPLEAQVAGALKRLGGETGAGLDGDTLVFLPGAGEIQRAQIACADYAAHAGLEIHLLHGELPSDAQDRAVAPGAKRKVILSTNVAETSVTIEGVTAVIDSGLHRAASHDPWSGLPRLEVEKISQASAIQRAGRAGRLRPGRCLRLFTLADFQARTAQSTPEIRRLDLAELTLTLAALAGKSADTLEFFEPPPASALKAAQELLRLLGALDALGQLTATGRRMLALPIHPRLAKIALAAEAAGLASEGASLAALLAERDTRARRGFEGDRSAARHTATGDPGERLEELQGADNIPAARLHTRGLDPAAVESVRRARAQIAGQLHPSAKNFPGSETEKDAALRLALLAGFPDRVAKRRAPGSAELVLSSGGTASLAPESVVRDAPFLIAIETRQRARGGALVTQAAAIELEWLLDINPDGMVSSDDLSWNAKNERVERLRKTRYGALTLEERREAAPPSAETSAPLLKAAQSAGLDHFIPDEPLKALHARCNLIALHCPESGVASFDDTALAEFLQAACDGTVSFAELAPRLTLAALIASLPPGSAQILARLAPETFDLPGRKKVPIQYVNGQPPWLAARLQDFFRLKKPPTVCDGRVPLVLHLLAPNQRALQVTSDLDGFWEKHYPKLRLSLMRRYPRHQWPEDPKK